MSASRSCPCSCADQGTEGNGEEKAKRMEEHKRSRMRRRRARERRQNRNKRRRRRMGDENCLGKGAENNKGLIIRRRKRRSRRRKRRGRGRKGRWRNGRASACWSQAFHRGRPVSLPGHVMWEYFGLPCRFSFYRMLHTRHPRWVQ